MKSFKTIIIFIFIILLFLLIKSKIKYEFFQNQIPQEPADRTISGKSCIAWKDAINFQEYGESRKCKNPEQDIGGSWCYTDIDGNYEYCDITDKFGSACRKYSILSGCFEPDFNNKSPFDDNPYVGGLKLVVNNNLEQPFNSREPHLEIKQILDSNNKIWALEKGRRIIKVNNKFPLTEVNWESMIKDSHHRYEVNEDSSFISTYGVYRGNYPKLTSEECFIVMKDTTQPIENPQSYIIKYPNEGASSSVFLSANSPGNSSNNNFELNLKTRRNNINLNSTDIKGKFYIEENRSDMTDIKKNFITIQRDRIHDGFYWGNLVLGEPNGRTYDLEIVGNTLPTKFNDTLFSEYEKELKSNNKKSYVPYFYGDKNRFFHKDFMIQMSKELYKINDLVENKKYYELKLNLYNISNPGSNFLKEEEKKFYSDVRDYIRYRSLLNDDYRINTNLDNNLGLLNQNSNFVDINQINKIGYNKLKNTNFLYVYNCILKNLSIEQGQTILGNLKTKMEDSVSANETNITNINQLKSEFERVLDILDNLIRTRTDDNSDDLRLKFQELYNILNDNTNNIISRDSNIFPSSSNPDNFQDFFTKLLENFENATIFSYGGENYKINTPNYFNVLRSDLIEAEVNNSTIRQISRFSEFLQSISQEVQFIEEIFPNGNFSTDLNSLAPSVSNIDFPNAIYDGNILNDIPPYQNIDIDGNTPVPSYSLDENEVTLFYNHIERIYEALVNFIGIFSIIEDGINIINTKLNRIISIHITPKLLGNQLSIDFNQLLRNKTDFNSFMIKYIEKLRTKNITSTSIDSIEMPKLNRKFIENCDLLLLLENFNDFANIDLSNQDKPAFEKSDEEILEIGYKIFEIYNEMVDINMDLGIQLGVVDFNVTKEHIYIDYLYPDSTVIQNPPSKIGDSNNDIFNWFGVKNYKLRKIRFNKQIDTGADNLIDIINNIDSFKDISYQTPDYPLGFSPSSPGQNQALYDLKIIEEDFLDLNDNNSTDILSTIEYINTEDYEITFPEDDFDRYYMIKKLFNIKISQIFKKKLDLKKKFIGSKVFVSNPDDFYLAYSNNQLLNTNLNIKPFSEAIEDLMEEENITNEKLKNVVEDFTRTKVAKLIKGFSNDIEKTYINNFYNIYIDAEKKKAKEFVDISKFYDISPGSISGTANIYGLLDYDNFVLNGEDITIDNNMEDRIVKPRKKVFFQMYFRAQNNKAGPLDLYDRTFQESTIVPEIKYTNNKGLLTWFMENTLQKKNPKGKFKNKEEWEDIYKTIKSEGFYNINPNGQQMVRDKLKPIANNLKTLFISLQNNPDTEQLRGEVKTGLKEILTKFKFNEKCDAYDANFPNIKLWKPEKKKYDNNSFLEIDFRKDLINGLQQVPIENIKDKVVSLEIDTEKQKIVEDNYSESKIQDFRDPDNVFKYSYHYLKLYSRDDLTTEYSICSDDVVLNKFNWIYKSIKNFDEYKKLVEGVGVKEKSLEQLRIRGLFNIENIYRDNNYYNYIKSLYIKISNPIVKKTLEKIIKEQKNNLFKGVGYPFIVIYKTVNYQGVSCMEGTSQNEQKIFLSYVLKYEQIVNKDYNLETVRENNSKPELKSYPLITEEFLSYTGFGSLIKFSSFKAGGASNVSPKPLCNFAAMPDMECLSGDSCEGKQLGLVNLDGTPNCALDNPEVKTGDSMSIMVPGNILRNSCSIYKIKGNKRVNYTLAKLFKYNNSGRYQVENQYSLKYGDKYFYIEGNDVKFGELDFGNGEVDKFAFNLEFEQDEYGIYIILSPEVKKEKYLTRTINIFNNQFEKWVLDDKYYDPKAKDEAQLNRNKLPQNISLDESNELNYNEQDLKYFAQKFNIPDSLSIKIIEDNPKIKTVKELKEKIKDKNINAALLRKSSPSLVQGENDNNVLANLSPKEEEERLETINNDIKRFLNRLDKVPQSYYEEIPDSDNLLNFIKNTTNTIVKAREFNIKRIRDLNWMIDSQLQANQEGEMENTENNQEIISAPSLSMPTRRGDLVPDETYFAESVRDVLRSGSLPEYEAKQCRTLEGFQNREPSISTNPEQDHISGKYKKHIKEEIESRKRNINEVNDNLHDTLQKVKTLYSSLNLDGDNKRVLLSQKIANKDKLDKDVLFIKEMEQQDRVNNIVDKLSQVERIRYEMDEDDFRTHKEPDDEQNVSVISREDRSFVNMYRIEPELTSSNPDHLLFINGGCLDYEPEKKDIKVNHCMASEDNQQFKIFRVEDTNDLNQYSISDDRNLGVQAPFNVVKSKDGKCLHKENGEVSLRNCKNTKEQYWDYSKITGPCN